MTDEPQLSTRVAELAERPQSMIHSCVSREGLILERLSHVMHRLADINDGAAGASPRQQPSNAKEDVDEGSLNQLGYLQDQCLMTLNDIDEQMARLSHIL